jgi:hypothetical protein
MKGDNVLTDTFHWDQVMLNFIDDHFMFAIFYGILTIFVDSMTALKVSGGLSVFCHIRGILLGECVQCQGSGIVMWNVKNNEWESHNNPSTASPTAAQGSGAHQIAPEPTPLIQSPSSETTPEELL